MKSFVLQKSWTLSHEKELSFGFLICKHITYKIDDTLGNKGMRKHVEIRVSKSQRSKLHLNKHINLPLSGFCPSNPLFSLPILSSSSMKLSRSDTKTNRSWRTPNDQPGRRALKISTPPAVYTTKRKTSILVGIHLFPRQIQEEL